MCEENDLVSVDFAPDRSLAEIEGPPLIYPDLEDIDS
jgi:hypothetical protein